MDEPAGPGASPWLFPGQTHWFDSFALDSVHDYDPVWRTCRELGFVAAFHGGLTVRPGLHWSITSYVANHVGQFAAEMYPLCKALLFGGVPARFPDLPVAVPRVRGVVGRPDAHRHRRALGEAQRRGPGASWIPARLDRDELGAVLRALRRGGWPSCCPCDPYEYVQRLPIHGSTPEELDEFRHLEVTSRRAIVEQFTRSFWFGCEAGDRGITTAYSPANAMGAPLHALLSSDIGHWDVSDMGAVVAESHELVEDGLLTPEQWREIVFENPVAMYTKANPAFFDGTAVAPHLPPR